MKQKLFHLVAQAKRNMFRSADQILMTALGISGTQVIALVIIQSHQGCSLKELAQYLQLKNAAITGLVSRLEANGFVIKNTSAFDKRAGCLLITDKGNALVDKARPLLSIFNHQLVADFSETEMATIVRFLQRTSTLTFTTEHEHESIFNDV